jgi:predicted AlkP superfamily phosphohydrolase/phosphomutase
VTPPLAVLALDSADPDLLLRWSTDGSLPALGSLLARGCHGRLDGPELCIKHGAWTGIYSGLSRREHGYNRRTQLRPGTYELMVPRLRDLNTLPFWTSLPEETTVAVLDAPEVSALRGLRGVQLTDWAVQNSRAGAATEPAELLGELRERFGQPGPLKAPQVADAEHATEFLAALSDQLRRKGELCRDLLARGRFDLAVIGFGEAHTAGHYFWPYCAEAQPRGGAPEPGPAALGRGTLEAFQAIDREVGRLFDVLPPDSNVFVVSDVGIQDGWPTEELTRKFTQALGYESPRPTAWLSRAHKRLHDSVPESWRRGLGRVIPHRLRERLNAGPLRIRADWSRTRAFALPSDHSGSLRVNLRGREPEGIVEPGTEYEALLGRIRSDLEQLVDGQTGLRAVERVVVAAEAFGGGPPWRLPDVVIHWAATPHVVEQVVHPRTVLRQESAAAGRRTQHSRSGLFAAAGPSIAGRGAVGSASPLALAPTFLALMGLPPRPGMSEGLNVIRPRD